MIQEEMMRIVLIVIGIIVVLCVVIEVWSMCVYRRWRKHFNSMAPEDQRKEQERLYKKRHMG